MRVPERVKHAVHACSRRFGELTAARRMLPSFLICGGQRCGTTSLYRALAAHPAIIKAVLHKGVHYFDIGYHHGPDWYRGHFPLQRHGIRVLKTFGVAAQTFESSPYYMYHPQAVRRIAADLPDVKIVVLVRDPIERAYSHHAHELARGFEDEPDFGRALSLEPARLYGAKERLAADPCAYDFSHQHHAYRARGEYVTYLKQMAAMLSRDRIHVVDSAEFFTDPEPVYDGVLRFLGLPNLGYPRFERHNARPRATGVPPQMREELTDHFQPYDAALARWLGRTPSWMA